MPEAMAAVCRRDDANWVRDGLAQLEREANLLDTNYRRYSENLEQARIDESLEAQRISNITVAQPATFNPKPASPKKLSKIFQMPYIICNIEN